MFTCRLHSCENAIGLMKNLQTSLPMEESWVDGKIEKFQAMPLGVSVSELNVSILNVFNSDYPEFVTKILFRHQFSFVV